MKEYTSFHYKQRYYGFPGHESGGYLNRIERNFQELSFQMAYSMCAKWSVYTVIEF